MGLKLGHEVVKWVDGWRLGRNLSRLFHPHTADELADYSAKGIIFLDNLREQAAKYGKDLNSVTADMITDAIPGELDDKLKEFIRDVIVPKVISNSLAVSECLKEPTTEQQIVCIFNIVIPAKPENERTVFWNGLAALFGHEIGLFLSGKKIDFISILKSIPLIFEEIFKKK